MDSLISDKVGKPPEKLLRMHVTNRYGYITFAITIAFLLIFPYWNKITIHRDNLVLRRIKLRLLKYRALRINPLTLQMVVFWTCVLTLLSCLETNNLNLNWIAARLGRVCVYCLPTVFFLTLRPSPLPDTLYLALIPVHKWLARLVVLQGVLHALYYCIINIQFNTPMKIMRFDNLLGVIATFAFIIIAITSISAVRRAAFNVFYINHYICSWVLVITLHGHARPGIPMVTACNTLILLYQIYCRFRITKVTWINSYNVSKHMTIVEIPNDGIRNKSNLPGCHIRMIEYDERNPFKQVWKNVIAPVQHPYTLASLPVDETQKLIVRTGRFDLSPDKKFAITGSYLPFLRFLKPIPRSPLESLSFITNVKKCLLIAGGSAISFVLPIARTLNYNGAMVKILWVIRDHEDLKVLDFFKKTISSDDMIDIFITGNYTNKERKDFIQVLADIRMTRGQQELAQEIKMLGGNYTNDSSEMEIDFTSIGKPTAITSTEETPLSKFQNSFNYGTGTASTCASSVPLETSFQHTMPMKKRRSYVDIRAHHNLGEYDDNNNNEESIDVDVELDISGKYNEHVQRTVTYSAPNATKPGVGFSDNMGGYSALSTSAKALATQSLNTASSSTLYDNLLDYWVLAQTSCKVTFGRPKLGLDYYSWCIGSPCVGPVLDSTTGEILCYNQDPQLRELYTNGTFIANQQARFKERGGRPDESVWVIGAGPEGLVASTRLWANDCGFNFHEESFSV